MSLWGLFRLKADVFEASLGTTSRVAERRLRLRQGRDLVSAGRTEARSTTLPSLPLFRGVGALVWKNLVAARRSRRQLLIGFILTALYGGALTALLWNALFTFGAVYSAWTQQWGVAAVLSVLSCSRRTGSAARARRPA